MRAAALAVVFTLLLTPWRVEGQVGPDDLEGAWRIVEMVSTGPGARTISSPQPGLLLFTGRYYSYTLISGDRPRPDLPSQRLPTAEELLVIWNPFAANAGTYEIAGDVMTRRPLVSKSPDAMAPGAFNEYTFRLSADTLWVTTSRNETGPARNPTTVRYLRLR